MKSINVYLSYLHSANCPEFVTFICVFFPVPVMLNPLQNAVNGRHLYEYGRVRNSETHIILVTSKFVIHLRLHCVFL